MGRTDLRYWPTENHHIEARKQIALLGHLARGYEEVAVVDGPVGTNMVTLPGLIKPSEWDPKRCVCLHSLSVVILR